MNKVYDVIILGGGPAGLTAGLYAGRGGLSALIIEKGQDGGQIALSSDVENYPGQPAPGETGVSLAERMAEQAARFGVHRRSDEIQAVDLSGSVKILNGKNSTYRARTVIIAAGAHPRPIGCENEEKFTGRGISFCATCDGPFFRGLDVYVAGGGDSAAEEALYLTKFARKVTIIHRRDQLRAAQSIQERVFAEPKISVLWNSVVQKVDGGDTLQTITVKNVKTGVLTTIEADEATGMLGLFAFIGYLPNSELFQGMLDMENGYLKTDENMCTNIPGVYAAGDIRVKKVRQAVTAAADGAIAAIQAERFLQESAVLPVSADSPSKTA